MISFLSEFTRDVDSPSTFIVMDADGLDQPRHYKVVPRNVLFLIAGAVSALSVILLAIVALTPVKELIPGYGSAEMRQDVRYNELRVTALLDSLESQQEYMGHLRQLMLGEVDADAAGAAPAESGGAPDAAGTTVQVEPPTNWSDHQQPAMSVDRLVARGPETMRLANAASVYLPGVALPALPPVDGFVTSGFDARSGHYAIDIAVEAGTTVRAIGDGYVVMADWTQDGGYALAVQHAGGYLSVYKHNQRLLKRTGDRVSSREPIAESGNSGEITTGPHLHFELWHNGLAQDPAAFLVNL
ncbi:MAG: M23 family metallopeptidase [Rhodothermales bacterium]